MNNHPQTSSDGDGRPPPGNRKGLGVSNGGTLKKSRERERRHSRSSHRSRASGQASSVITAANQAGHNHATNSLVTSTAPRKAGGDTAASIAGSGAPVEATQTSASTSAAGQVARAQFLVSEDEEVLAAAAQLMALASSYSSAPNASSRPSSTTGASSSSHQVHCPHCPKKYKSLAGLRFHVINVHDQENIFHCIRCRFTATDRRTVMAHLETHAQRHHCPICRERISLVDYAEHIRTHKRR